RSSRAAWARSGRLWRWYSQPLPRLRLRRWILPSLPQRLTPRAVVGRPGSPASSAALNHSRIAAALLEQLELWRLDPAHVLAVPSEAYRLCLATHTIGGLAHATARLLRYACRVRVLSFSR